MRPVPIRWGRVTVPFTAMWTWEAERRVPQRVPSPFPLLPGVDFLSEGVDHPEGKPMFKMLHQDRCRYVVRRRLCQMTLQPLQAWVYAMNQGQRDRIGPVISDGLPMNLDGARTAYEQCPGLQAQAASGALHIYRVPLGAWVVAPVILRPRDPQDGGDERVNQLLRAGPLYSGPRLVLNPMTARRVSPDDLMLRKAS